MRARAWALALVATAALVSPAGAAEIDACKYVAVTPLPRDPLGIVDEARKQAAERGFTVVTEAGAVPAADAFKACIINADWLGNNTSGEVVIQVMDAVTGTPVAVARVGGLNWSSVDRSMRARMTQVFQSLGYTGFKEDIYRQRMERLYPPRPKMIVTEADVARRTQDIEGIWTDVGQQYRLGIVGLVEPGGPDFAAVVLSAAAPLWDAGEVKAEFKKTEDAGQYLVTYFLLNKQPVTLNLLRTGNDRLSGMLTAAGQTLEITLLRAE